MRGFAGLLDGGPSGRVPVRLRRTRAIDPAAAAIRQAKMLLFAPGALTGQQAAAPKTAAATVRRPPKAGVIATTLTSTLKAMSISAPSGSKPPATPRTGWLFSTCMNVRASPTRSSQIAFSRGSISA